MAAGQKRQQCRNKTAPTHLGEYLQRDALCLCCPASCLSACLLVGYGTDTADTAIPWSHHVSVCQVKITYVLYVYAFSAAIYPTSQPHSRHISMYVLNIRYAIERPQYTIHQREPANKMLAGQ